MKRIAFFALTAGLILSTGCGKKEKEVPAEPLPEAPKESKTQLPEKVTTVKETVTETSKEMVEKAKQSVQQAKEAVHSFLIKDEDVKNDLTLPVSAIKEKVANYSQPQLMAYANQYKETILENKDQLAGLTEQLKALPVRDLFSTQGKALKEKVAHYTGQLSALKERYSVYLDKLKALGVDLSAFGI